MWDYIINIHPSELLSTKTKESRINKSQKKKKFVLHNNFFKKRTIYILYLIIIGELRETQIRIPN